MIEYFEELDSTNAYCLREHEDLLDRTLVVALSQTAGRGRCGRHWHSPPGQNFYGSLILKAPFGKNVMQNLTQIAGLAVTDTLPKFGLTTSWIKWPNDVFVGNSKICGVLAESGGSGTQEVLVIGMGVNLNMPENELNAIDRPATSIFKETGQTTQLEPFAEELYDNLLHWWDIAMKDPDTLYSSWVDANPLIGNEVEVVTPTASVIGTAVDITRDGAIVVRHDGQDEAFMSGDVSLRI